MQDADVGRKWPLSGVVAERHVPAALAGFSHRWGHASALLFSWVSVGNCVIQKLNRRRQGEDGACLSGCDRAPVRQESQVT